MSRIHLHPHPLAKFFAISDEWHPLDFSRVVSVPASRQSHPFFFILCDAKDFHNEVGHHRWETSCFSSVKSENILCFAVYLSSNKWVVFWSKEIPSVISRAGPVTYAAISDDPVQSVWLWSNEKQFEWADKQIIHSFPPPFFFSLLPLFSSLCLLIVCPSSIFLVVFTKEICIRYVEQNYCDSAALGALEWSPTRPLYVNVILHMRLIWKEYF